MGERWTDGRSDEGREGGRERKGRGGRDGEREGGSKGGLVWMDRRIQTQTQVYVVIVLELACVNTDLLSDYRDVEWPA